MNSTTMGARRRVGLCVLLASNFAGAEPGFVRPNASSGSMSHNEEGTLESLFYAFDDDVVNALGQESQGMLLRVRPEAARVVLLRPRVQFVSELLQSVESL